MEETSYKYHFELLDRYQAFSAEVLRLSLASIGAFGFFLSIDHGVGHDIAIKITKVSHWLVASGLVMLVIASAAALTHRYVSADSMYYILKRIERGATEKEEFKLHSLLKRSEIAIMVAPAALAVGVSLLTLGFLSAW